jgi:hypothetical protein
MKSHPIQGIQKPLTIVHPFMIIEAVIQGLLTTKMDVGIVVPTITATVAPHLVILLLLLSTLDGPILTQAEETKIVVHQEAEEDTLKMLLVSMNVAFMET